MLQKVVRSTVIDAPIERVWAVLRDFNSHDQWHDVVDDEPHRRRRAQRPGRLRAQLHAEGRQPHPRAAADARPTREHKSTYCIVEATVPLQRYVATRDAEAGDRRQPHVLALGIDLRHAAGPGARAARHGGARRLRGRLREPAPAPARRAATCARRGAAPMPTALPLPTRRIVAAAATATPTCCSRATARPPAPGAGEVRIRQRAIGVNFIDVYLRRGWIPAMLPPGPACPAWRPPARVIDVGAGVSGVLPGDRVAYLGPLPGAYCSVRTVPAEWVRAPAAGGRRRRRRGAAAQGHHRRLPAARPRPRRAPARACWCTRRPAASACWCARGRGGSAPS